MLKQNSKLEILNTSGVDVLHVKKGSRLEDHGYPDGDSGADARTDTSRERGKGKNKVRNRSFVALGFNLAVIALMIMAYRFFTPAEKPAVLMDGYVVSLFATTGEGEVLWIAEIEKKRQPSTEYKDLRITVFQDEYRFSQEQSLPVSIGEKVRLTGLFETLEPGKTVSAEITIGNSSGSLSVRPQPKTNK